MPGHCDVQGPIRIVMRHKRDEISRQLEGEEPVFGLMPSTSAQAIASCSQAGNIAELQGQLSELLVDFTEKHPRIVMLRETIAISFRTFSRWASLMKLEADPTTRPQ